MNYSKAVRGMFSSSLPVLPHEKLINNAENDYQAIGSLLPNEDDLLADVIDGFDPNLTPNRVDELEDFDIFGSGGGMELEYDMMDNLNLGMSNVCLGEGFVTNGGAHYNISNGVGTASGVQHPCGEHPSRTLFVRNINSNVEDSELRALFEQYGDIRTLYTACKHRGFVMISYYDIRAARTAMRALQNKPLRRRKLDIHYSIPKDNPSDKDINQGTLVIFNLDPSVSCEELVQIFGAYGEVKEIRETPYKRHHKFIEYYDVRAADAALRALNRSDIAGKRIKLEHSRPGGSRRNQMMQLSHEFDQDDARSFRLQADPLFANSPPGVWSQFGSPIEHSLTNSPVFTSLGPHSLPALVSVAHTHPARMAPIGKDYNSSQSNASGSGFSTSGSTTSGIETLSGTEFLWGSPKIPSHGFTGQPGPYLGTSQQLHHVGSAPSGYPFDRNFSQNHDPHEALFTSPPRGLGFLNPGGSIIVIENGAPSFGRMSPRIGHVFLGTEHYPGLGSFNIDSPRNHWVDHNANQMDNTKQFQLDLDNIINGEDNRTTLMIKNIPNKYTSKMLLAAINERHCGTYDFLYLPIDFKNKCNVGYAFINMISPMHVILFYQDFNGKRWEKFNSEKVATLAYARIQGKAALVTHFQNSSLMNEDIQCRPLLFESEGSDGFNQEHPYAGEPLASPPDGGGF